MAWTDSEGLRMVWLWWPCFPRFFGDIDPVSYLNRRLGNIRADYNLCGSIVAGRALKSLKYANFIRQVDLGVKEQKKIWIRN